MECITIAISSGAQVCTHLYKCCQARDFCLWKRQPLKSLPCLAQTCKELMGNGLQRRHWHDITLILESRVKPGKSVCSPETGTDLRVQIVAQCCSHTAGVGMSCIGLTPNGVGFAEWRMSTCSSNGPFPQFASAIETIYDNCRAVCS